MRVIQSFAMSSSNPVVEQYARYPYPEPGDDIPTWLQKFNYDVYEPRDYSVLFWPEGRPRADLNVLVAGCGSMQAAVVAYNNPGCRVTGIDFSPASIAHEERLRTKHQLVNLTLHAMDLREVARLGQQYDQIISSGVLHHLPDPAAGLRALASVLEPAHGVMVLMLYGQYGRSGIYPLQDAFRRLGIPQSPEGVAQIRAIIGRLPPRHPARQYLERAGELKSDAAIVDTFLHRQDVAYRVQDVLDFVETNGLKFQGWLDNAIYNVGLEERDWGIGRNVPDRDRWCIVESLTMDVTNHLFLACRPERDRKSEIGFSDERWLAYYPVRHPALRPSMLERHKFARERYEFVLSSAEAALLDEATGRRSAADALKHQALGRLSVGERKTLGRDFYDRMWQHGHLHFSAVPVKA